MLDGDKEEWHFSIVDVVEVPTDSVNPKPYIKKMHSRDPELNANWGIICTLVPMIEGRPMVKKHRAIAPLPFVALIRRIYGITYLALDCL